MLRKWILRFRLQVGRCCAQFINSDVIVDVEVCFRTEEMICTYSLDREENSGFVPIFVYAIFGSSRQLAIGPVTLVSLLVSNVLGSIVDSLDSLYTELAILLALAVGILECIMGLLRLGWLIRFISHSVISGFTTSSAIVIALSQAKYFLGYSIVRSSKIVSLIRSIIAGDGKLGLFTTVSLSSSSSSSFIASPYLMVYFYQL